jgi:hypothetical protein
MKNGLGNHDVIHGIYWYREEMWFNDVCSIIHSRVKSFSTILSENRKIFYCLAMYEESTGNSCSDLFLTSRRFGIQWLFCLSFSECYGFFNNSLRKRNHFLLPSDVRKMDWLLFTFSTAFEDGGGMQCSDDLHIFESIPLSFCIIF